MGCPLSGVCIDGYNECRSTVFLHCVGEVVQTKFRLLWKKQIVCRCTAGDAYV